MYVNLHTFGRGRLEGEQQAVCEALYSYFLQQRDITTYRIQLNIVNKYSLLSHNNIYNLTLFAASNDNNEVARGRAVEILDYNYFCNLQVLMMITSLQLLYKQKNLKL